MAESRDETKPITLSLEEGGRPAARRRWTVLTILAIAGACAMPLLPASELVRALGSAVCIVLAIVPELLRRSGRSRAGETAGAGASLLVDAKGVWRQAAGRDAACITRWDEPFGVVVLSNPGKTRALLAFSSAERTRLVPIRIDGAAEADAARLCLEPSFSVTDADLDEALGGASAGLSGRSASRLFAELERRAGHAVGAIYLCDAAGAKVTLEGDKLRVRDKLIDLSDPLEWRSYVFHEGGPIVTPTRESSGAIPAPVILYQATWARQGATELVMVCPLPAEASSWGMRGSDAPPPRELRVAVDRLFMLPLRKALEGAPRISRIGASARKSGAHAART
jgi:hypothetical protein